MKEKTINFEIELTSAAKSDAGKGFMEDNKKKVLAEMLQQMKLGDLIRFNNGLVCKFIKFELGLTAHDTSVAQTLPSENPLMDEVELVSESK